MLCLPFIVGAMIPLSKCKKALGPAAKDLTDEEIEKIRDILDQLADVLFDHWIKKRNQEVVAQDIDH